MDSLHLNTPRLTSKKLQILLLLIPFIVFVLVTALSVQVQKSQIAGSVELSVLGTNKEVDSKTK